MFGMLDYRAHKLYAFLVSPVVFALRLIAIFVLPLISYLIGVEVVSNRALQILVALLASVLIGIPWYFIVKLVVAIPEAIFNFLIDVIPADGRTREEAKAVVCQGEFAINILSLNKPAAEWRDEAIHALAYRGMFAWYFGETVEARLHALRNHYLENPTLVPSDYNARKFLDRSGLKMGIAEQVLTNVVYRGWAISYSVLVLLLWFNPAGPRGG